MTGAPLALVAALPEELRAIHGRLREVARQGGDPPVRRGHLAGQEVVAAVLGVGPRLAKRRLAALLTAHPVRGVLLVGLAGGLDPTLLRNDVILATDLVAPDRDVTPPDRAWLGRVATPAGLRLGVVATTAHLVASPADKAAVRARFDGRPVAVDMESAAVAEVAAAHGVPYLVLRAVSDTADETLPAFLGEAAGPDGALSRWRVLRSVLARPSRIRALADLGRRAREGARVLADAAEGILRLEDEASAQPRASSDV